MKYLLKLEEYVEIYKKGLKCCNILDIIKPVDTIHQENCSYKETNSGSKENKKTEAYPEKFKQIDQETDGKGELNHGDRTAFVFNANAEI